jgi:sporulation integral membrane protein YtvI
MSAGLVAKLTQHTIQITVWFMGFLGILLIVLVAAVLIVKDQSELQDKLEQSRLYNEFHKITQKLSEVGMAYLRTQGIIMIIVAAVCIIGLSLLHNSYALLIGIGIAFMDALPVLGSFLVLVPWAVIALVSGNIYEAAVLVTLFLVCQLIREILEPKLIGNRIGIKPLFTLIAMYVGVKLFSVAGFILGPVGLIIIQTIYQVVIDYTIPVTGGHPGET